MSLASATGQVIFSQKGGVYMPSIQCNQGDLYQEYMGEASAPTNIAPDFVSLKPVLSFILTCNLQIFLCLFLEKLNMPQNTPVTKAS